MTTTTSRPFPAAVEATTAVDPAPRRDGASFLSGRTGIGVHQRRKFFELRNSYRLTGEDGEDAGSVEQVDQSRLTFLARLFSDLDVSLPIHLEVRNADGSTAIRLHKRWFRYRVTVEDAAGAPLGQVRKRIRLGKARFEVRDRSGTVLGRLRAESWRAKDFPFEDRSGLELGRVTKRWRGLLTEVATDADSYAVTFGPGTEAPLRQLVLAAALAVDVTMKQKDYVSPLDLLDLT